MTKKQGTEFCVKESCVKYLNLWPFKYYISILGESEAMLILLTKGEGVQNLEKHAYIILEHFLTKTHH